MVQLDISDLLQFGADSRKLRAYAYLTASFKEKPNTADTIDCLLPFLAAGVAQQAGNFLDIDELGRFLGGLGLRIPYYVLMQLVPRLANSGEIEWNPAAHRHFCKQSASQSASSQIKLANLNIAFEALEDEFTLYASNLGIKKPPVSSSWSDALIGFLRSETASDTMKTALVKDILVGDSRSLEAYIIARFIQDKQTTNQSIFDSIIQIFSGIIIEDFIINIQAVGDTNKYHQLHIYYDTTVLLRLLGTSGLLFQTATVEMHRSLQDLGCKCGYLEYTEDEVAKILNAIITANDGGAEIFGETAEAILNQEVSISQLRDLVATFPQRLAEMNIFPVPYNSAARKSEDIYQISEQSFATELTAEALKRDRNYKGPTALNDARAVAIILRMRRGVAKRDLSACGHLFVSNNNILQNVAKRFTTKHVEGYEGQAIPPVLTLGQITTVAWLATAKTIEPPQVSKELLAACFSAVRPSTNWTLEFSRALEQFRTEQPGFIEARANAVLFLQTARNHARDESLNQPAVLKKANIAEIFAKAAAESDAKQKAEREAFQNVTAQLQTTLDEERRVAAEKAVYDEANVEAMLKRIAEQAANDAAVAAQQTEARIELATREAIDKVRKEQIESELQKRKDMIEARATMLARLIKGAIQIILAALLCALAILYGLDYWVAEKPIKTLVDVLLGIVLGLSVLDLCGWKVVAAPVRSIEKALARKIASRLAPFFGLQPVHNLRQEPKIMPAVDD